MGETEQEQRDEGWRPVFAPDGSLTEEFRASLREYVDAELDQTTDETER